MEATLYDVEFLQSVQLQISKKLALFTNKDIKNIQLDLGLNLRYENYQYLGRYWEILNRIQECNCCYNNINIGDMLSNIQSQLNKL